MHDGVREVKKAFKHWLAASSAAVAVVFGAALPASAAGPVSPGSIWMMGEVHDNPEAHFFRLSDLSKVLGGSWRPALLMEQFDVDQQAALTQAWQTCKDAACVIKQAGASNGWDWSHYEPLIELALKYRLPLVAANLSTAKVREVMKSGYGAVFDQKTIQQYGLDRPLPAAFLASQTRAIAEGHCNALDPQTVQAMVKGQVARDVTFARLVREFAPQGVVLIAGNGHVRRDIGILQWLPPEVASRVVVSGYVEPEGADAALFDRMRVVQAHKRPDPCLAFKQRQAR